MSPPPPSTVIQLLYLLLNPSQAILWLCHGSGSGSGSGPRAASQEPCILGTVGPTCPQRLLFSEHPGHPVLCPAGHFLSEPICAIVGEGQSRRREALQQRRGTGHPMHQPPKAKEGSALCCVCANPFYSGKPNSNVARGPAGKGAAPHGPARRAH